MELKNSGKRKLFIVGSLLIAPLMELKSRW